MFLMGFERLPRAALAAGRKVRLLRPVRLAWTAAHGCPAPITQLASVFTGRYGRAFLPTGRNTKIGCESGAHGRRNIGSLRSLYSAPGRTKPAWTKTPQIKT